MQVMFEVALNCVNPEKGIITVPGLDEKLHITTSPRAADEGRWVPEHLFLGSVSSNFMSTFMLFAERADLPVAGFECPSSAKISITGAQYAFTAIDLFPTIFLNDEDFRGLAEDVLELAQEECILANMVKVPVYYHCNIMTVTEAESLRESMITMRREIM